MYNLTATKTRGQEMSNAWISQMQPLGPAIVAALMVSGARIALMRGRRILRRIVTVEVHIDVGARRTKR
jgi:hypothetical protein